MKVRIIGGGWYGSHLALTLLRAGHEVQLHESAGRLFSGASGNNPARLHQGFHYPRSRLTRAACQDHNEAFLQQYGFLTRAIPLNLYAVAQDESLVDFGNYVQALRDEVQFIVANDPADFGLCGVEGAVQTGERHILIDEARDFFTVALGEAVWFNQPAGDLEDPAWDATIDCTFCALDYDRVDRYEPCLMALLEGPTNVAVTIMDGPFPSLYPWDESQGLSSLTSALYTPLSKTCRTWAEAKDIIDHVSPADLRARAEVMFAQLVRFYPIAASLYRIVDLRRSIRAMPKSAADARLVDVVRTGRRSWGVRAGKVDAVFRAEALIKEALC